MEDTLDYIDRYFRGELSVEERSSFEGRCETDQTFAGVVAFYVTARQQVQEEVRERRKEEFGKLYKELSAGSGAPGTGSAVAPAPVRRLRPVLAVAAACLLLVAGWWVFFRGGGPGTWAERYIDSHFSALPVTMSGGGDSLQAGVDAYNKKEYDKAEALFAGLVRSDSHVIEARKYLGILWLVRGDYDKALAAFDWLIARQDLFSNPGPFYKALTLMKRSAGGDRQEAKRLLQEVVDKRLPGSEEAARWVDKL